MPPVVEISLRRLRLDDVEPQLEAARESVEQVFPWMPWCRPDYSLDDSKVWIESTIAAWEAKTAFEFAIVDGSDRILGGCGLNQFKPDRMANVGYWVRTSATKSGVATAAVKRIMQFAFNETDFLRLEIVIAVGNIPSRRVAARVGAINEGIAHDRLFLHGKSHDALIFALLRSRHYHG